MYLFLSQADEIIDEVIRTCVTKTVGNDLCMVVLKMWS